MSCASPPPAPATSTPPVSSRAQVSTSRGSHQKTPVEEGERYLTNVFQFGCAHEYIPYPEGEVPPVPVRTEAERAKREEQLKACEQAVARKYTDPATIKAITWNGTRHSLSPATMKWVAQHGDRFLNQYVEHLLAGEIQREGEAGKRSEVIAGTQ